MSIEAAVYTLATEALGSDRVYPMRLPTVEEDPTFGWPAASYQMIDPVPRNYSHDGQDSLVTDRFQITCYGSTYDEAIAMDTLIRAQFSGFKGVVAGTTIGSVFLDGGREDNDPETGRFRRITDLLISYQEE